MDDSKFNFVVSYLKLISLFFALMGGFWAITGMFDPFGFYEREMAQSFWQTETLPENAETTFRFLLGPLGATCTGYFLMQFFLAKHAFARREMWGYIAVVGPFLTWFFLDTIICMIHKAYFNIYLANVPALLAMLPVFYSHRYFKPGKEKP